VTISDDVVKMGLVLGKFLNAARSDEEKPRRNYVTNADNPIKGGFLLKGPIGLPKRRVSP
jgi:hypothetical protein